MGHRKLVALRALAELHRGLKPYDPLPQDTAGAARLGPPRGAAATDSSLDACPVLIPPAAATL